MENPRPEKVAVVDEVRERLGSSSAALLTEYRGLDVTAIGELRRALREAGGDYKIYKNTLVRFAARDLELELEDLLSGPTAIAFVTEKPDGSTGDAVDVAKALRDFAKANPALVVKGGILGDRRMTADEARALADLEPREVVLAKLAGAMAAPMQQLAGLLQAIPRDFAYGLKALIDQGGASGATGDGSGAPAATDDSGAPAATDDSGAEADAPAADESGAGEAGAETTDTDAAEETPAADTTEE